MSTNLARTKGREPLPTPLQALNYELPPDFWLQAVGVEFENKEDKKTYVDSLHFINGEGRVVCNCPIHPLTSGVYAVAKVPPQHRHLYCADSVTYLRSLVRRLQSKEGESK